MQIWPMKLVVKIARSMRADINIQVGGKIMFQKWYDSDFKQSKW